jgi:hypothetical protein
MTVSAIVWGLLALGYGVSSIQLFLQGWERPPRGRVLPFVAPTSLSPVVRRRRTRTEA